MATPAELITQLYIGYYNRAPDPAGLNYWIGIYNSGQSITQIAEYFALQDESKAAYPYLAAPNVADPNAFVASIYQNLFGRAATTEDKAYWVGELQAGRVTPGAFIATIQYSANVAGTGPDFTTLKNKTTVGLDYAVDLANAGVAFTQASAKDVIAGVNATDASVAAGLAKTDAFIAGGGGSTQSFSLTTGVDTFTGGAGADTFTAGTVKSNDGLTDITTLSASDTLRGGGGVDTLNITTAAAGSATGGADIAAIEIINVRHTLATTAGAATVDASTTPGATQVWVDRGTGDVTVTNLAAGAAGGVRGNSTVIAGDLTFGYATATSAATIALDGGVKAGTGKAANAADEDTASVSIVYNGDATSATIVSTGAANSVNNINLNGNGGAASVKTLTINATSDVTVAGAEFSGNAATTLTDWITGMAADSKIVATGTGKVNVGTIEGNVAEIDASGNSGGVTVGGGFGATDKFTGGSGGDTLAVNAAVTTGSVNAGEGTDRLTVLDDIAVDSAEKAAKFVGFEILRASEAGADAYNLANFTGLTAVEIAGTGNATVTGIGAQTVTVIGDAVGDVTLGKTGVAPAGSDALTVTLDNAVLKSADGVDVGNLSVANIDTLTIVSKGGNITVANDSNSVGSLATGNADLEIVTIQGDTAFSLTTGASALDTVDASTLAGDFVLDASANTGAVKITGSATGKNTITGSAQADTIVGGAAVDTFTGGMGGDTLTGGAGADIFNIRNFETAAGTGTIGAAQSQGGVDRETITIAADGVDEGDETATIVYTLNGVSAVLNVNLAAVDPTSAGATATAIAAAIDAVTGIGASAVGAAITVATDANNPGSSLAINSISFGGTVTTLAGAIANGSDTPQIQTVTVDVDPVVGETYTLTITPRGVAPVTVSVTAATVNPQDLVDAFVTQINAFATGLGGIVVAADVVAPNVTQFTLTDVNADNGGFQVTGTGVSVISYTGDSNVTVAGDVVSGFDKITDYQANSDVIRIAAVNDVAAAAAAAPVAGTSVQIDANGKAVFAAADNNLAKKVTALAADNTNVGSNKVVFFEDGGNTFVYGAGVDTTNAAADFLVQLTGVVGLTKITETPAGDFVLG